MALENQTTVDRLIIKGLSDIPNLQAPIFFLVLMIYFSTMAFNMIILLLVCRDHQLHTPMYFFLGNLSFIDMSSSTVTLHTIMISFILRKNTVSFSACMTQMFLYLTLIAVELFLLTTMSYDRYVAICNPLHYHMIMNHKVCILLTVLCWVLGLIEAIPFFAILSNFSCYMSNIIDHFFCDMMPLINISCSDTFPLKIFILVEGLVLSVSIRFFITFLSYAFIIVSILKIRSSTGRRKAFYTCSSHLTVVILLYGSLASQYIIAASLNISGFNKFFALFNTVAMPVLNPLVYSLKNREIKLALRRLLRSLQFTS